MRGSPQGVESRGVVGVADDRGELVSSEAGGDAVAAPVAQSAGGRGEDRVPGSVAVGVVDVLEVVQVDQDDQCGRVSDEQLFGAGGPSGTGVQASQRVAAGGGQAADEETAVDGPAERR